MIRICLEYDLFPSDANETTAGVVLTDRFLIIVAKRNLRKFGDLIFFEWLPGEASIESLQIFAITRSMPVLFLLYRLLGIIQVEVESSKSGIPASCARRT